ncbi:flagellar basal body rod protein FlgC [Planctomicrobium sp. SH668]|uniref:flagellar basal body rod protein FlgC n=1 Tax=Planctomicrobium sp. SH668 TaxID=3448126 RepID=UPI003F5C8893
MGQLFSSTMISGSGLTAERLRMEVAANNIANAHSTSSAAGGAYRRQQVVFAEAIQDFLPGQTASPNQISPTLNGVEVLSVEKDPSELPKVYNPGHPDAGADGFVEMPNVKLSTEMVDLMTANRAYEANLKSLQTFRQMAEQALSLMRSNG